LPTINSHKLLYIFDWDGTALVAATVQCIRYIIS